jgi:phage minor structural protein
MPTETRINDTNESITYTCEHVLATLLDDVMNGYHQYTNYTTRQALEYILSLQETERWVLGQIDFTRYFSYSFENENGLLAPILSIPKPFSEPYEFTFDTENYPWTLNLIQASDVVKAEIRWGKDMIDFSEVSDPTDIVNYLIPKGSGEGVNQVTIESVNGGLNYLKDDASIVKWGKRSYIWIDSRFEDAQTLKDNAQALLEQWKEPKVSFPLDSTDLSILPEFAQERKILNGVTRIIVDDENYYGRIIGENITDLSKEYDVSYDINNKLNDMATTQTDIERKQQVNDAYSQGATNIINFTYQDNCDSVIPAIVPFYIDDDVVNVNTCELTFRTKAFRAYSQATDGGGATVSSTSSGGGTSKSTDSGGGSAQTSSSGGNSTVIAPTGFIDSVSGGTSGAVEYTGGGHFHTFSISGASYEHTHTIDIPAHTHSVNIPAHSHSFNTPDHSHEVTLPNHEHGIKHGIYELETTPSSVAIKVDGNLISHDSTTGDRINLVNYMNKESSGKITRGRHEVEILPNGLARIEADLILRVFIQSRLGGNY